MNKTISIISTIILIIALSSCVANQAANSNNSNDEMNFIDPNTYQLYDIAKDAKYAYTQTMAVGVGGHKTNEGRLNQRRYLNALLGPKGEEVTFKHVESCCYHKKRNREGNIELTYLDQYELQIKGNQQRFVIFMNAFEKGELIAPKGFTFKIKE